MTDLIFGAGPICRGFSSADDFSIALRPLTVSSATGGSAGALRDANTVTAAGVNQDYVFSVQLNDSPGDGTVVTNLTPGVATFTGSGSATWGSDGLAEVEAVNATLGTRIVKQLVQRNAFASATAFSSYITGALAADLSTLIDAATSGGASPAKCARFSSLATNTRNASLWCAGIVDDTAITREADTFTLNALIGSHHVLFAAHVGCAGQLGFVGSDGVGYVGTVDGTGTVTGTDIAIAYVRDATPGEIAAYNAAHASSKPATSALSVGIAANVIKPMAMFPGAVWASSGAVALPLSAAVADLPNGKVPPLFHTTRNNAIGIWDLVTAPATTFYAGGGSFANEFEIAQSAVASRAPFSAFANVGGTASGDLSYTAIPVGSTLAADNPSLGAGYPILLGTNHDAPVNGGTSVFDPWIALYTSQIQTLMQSLAQAAGDPAYATYAPIIVSIAGYAAF